MARPNKSVSKKNKDKVVVAYLKDPTKSEPEIAKETWVAKSTVHDIKAKSGEIGKDEKIVEICEKDMEIITKANLIAERFLDDVLSKDELDRADVEQSRKNAETSTRRYSLFVGNATDGKGWLNVMKDLSTEELLKMIDG